MPTPLRITFIGLLSTILSFSSFAQQGGQFLGFTSSKSSKVSVPLLVPNGALSLEAWVYYTGASFATGKGHHTIMEFGDDTPWFGVNALGQLELFNVAAGGAVPLRTWTHVAYTWDGANGALFVNGTQVATSTKAPWTLPTANNLGIGYNTDDMGWEGFIDEVMVWKDDRSEEILLDMQSGVAVPPADLLAYFKFENVTGQTVANQVPGGPAGTLGSTNAVEANDPVPTTSVVTSTRRNAATWAQLQGAYPNPVAAEGAVLPFVLTRSAHVRLAVLDMAGREVAVLLDAPRPAGNYALRFSPAGLAAGMYVCQLSLDGQRLTQPLLVQ
ncbi:LamG-like jellyroll fold domain-containing protein [Hymenobacter latericus]|uniref:LamG-like jellyroll fold domain-containing protein n=1 Tax=Hymenobacter sp. YIM 151858-1 TaxID=2987688 RepID=UPI002227BBB6|nr:LamG-like jellyroll fold domain-containing protein [Hymenobacter sp. YIM 151858-1]UYZ59670.1 T9SS type A sorting domain-containing protein [Hymenobacter sp. YIM 151858-1]